MRVNPFCDGLSSPVYASIEEVRLVRESGILFNPRADHDKMLDATNSFNSENKERGGATIEWLTVMKEEV
jgi:hypothetical protein